MRIRLKRLAIVLLKSSNKCLLVGLSNCIANGIPSLSMASLFFVAWISSFICSAAYHNFRSIAYPILAPQLQEFSASGRTSDERLLASFALDKLTNSSGIEWYKWSNLSLCFGKVSMQQQQLVWQCWRSYSIINISLITCI